MASNEIGDTGDHPGAYVSLGELLRFESLARGFSLLPRQPLNSLLAGPHAFRLRGRGLNFEELRHYRPGDDIRTMDWKTTNRTRSPYVRVYTEEREHRVMLLIDQRVTMFFGSQRVMKSVLAAQVAALFAWNALQGKDCVGSVIFDDQQDFEIRPHRSQKHLLELLDQIVAANGRLHANAGSVPDQLNEALDRTLRLCGHDCLVCVISDLCGFDDRSEQLLGRLRQHNDVLIGLVQDPMETELAMGDALVVSDGARLLEVDAGKHDLGRQYRAGQDSRFNNIQSILARLSIPLLPLTTQEAPEDQLRNLLNPTYHGASGR